MPSSPSANRDGRRSTSFWRPPAWKWFVLVPLAGLAFLIFRIPRRVQPESRPADLSSATSKPAAPKWDGAYPHMVLSPVSGSTSVKFAASISGEQPTIVHNSPTNSFEVDLHNGAFMLRQTDLFLPDVIPLSLTRTYHVWDNHSRAFGTGTNHPYDICPTGTRFPYTYMNLNLEDDRAVHFPRISAGTGYADAVFRHDETSSEFYGAVIAWNGNGWTLTLPHGGKVQFPEAYNAKTYAQGAPLEITDREGNTTRLQRSQIRNLEKLTSASGRTISFKYDDQNRITEATSDDGQVRRYSYDLTGHLSTVASESQVLYRFGYAQLLNAAGFDPYVMTRVLDGGGNILLQNSYGDNARVTTQRTAVGNVYRYDYLFDKSHQVVETTVTLPSGEKKIFLFHDGLPAGER